MDAIAVFAPALSRDEVKEDWFTDVMPSRTAEMPTGATEFIRVPALCANPTLPPKLRAMLLRETRSAPGISRGIEPGISRGIEPTAAVTSGLLSCES